MYDTVLDEDSRPENLILKGNILKSISNYYIFFDVSLLNIRIPITGNAVVITNIVRFSIFLSGSCPHVAVTVVVALRHHSALNTTREN